MAAVMDTSYGGLFSLTQRSDVNAYYLPTLHDLGSFRIALVCELRIPRIPIRELTARSN